MCLRPRKTLGECVKKKKLGGPLYSEVVAIRSKDYSICFGHLWLVWHSSVNTHTQVDHETSASSDRVCKGNSRGTFYGKWAFSEKIGAPYKSFDSKLVTSDTFGRLSRLGWTRVWGILKGLEVGVSKLKSRFLWNTELATKNRIPTLTGSDRLVQDENFLSFPPFLSLRYVNR